MGAAILVLIPWDVYSQELKKIQTDILYLKRRLTYNNANLQINLFGLKINNHN